MWRQLCATLIAVLFTLATPQRAQAIGEIFVILADGTLVYCEDGVVRALVNMSGSANAGTKLGNVNNLAQAFKPPPPAAGGGAAGGSALGTVGILAVAVVIAVAATVTITAINDYNQTGDAWHTWKVIGDGFAAADNLQKIAPGSMGVWGNLGNDAVNNFWGPGTPFKWWTKPPASTLVSPGQPNYAQGSGTGNAWSFAACMCPTGGGWGMCIGYTIGRCADQTPYGQPLTDYFPDFVRGDGKCGPDPTSTAYRGLRKWCRQGGSWPTAEPQFHCVTSPGCN